MKELQSSSVRQNRAHKAHTVLRGKTGTAEQYAGLKKNNKKNTDYKRNKNCLLKLFYIVQVDEEILHLMFNSILGFSMAIISI